MTAHVENFLGDDVSQDLVEWETLEDVLTEGWVFLVVVPVVVLVHLVEVVTIVSGEAVESVDSWEGEVIDITTVDIVVAVVLNVLSVDVTEDGDKVDLVTEDSLVDLWGDDILLEEDLDEEDIPVGDIGEVNILSVDLTEDGVEVDVAADDGLEDLWGDDVLLEEDLDEEDFPLGDGVEVGVLGVDLTDDVVEVDLVMDDSLVDLWGDDVLVEEDLDEEVVTVGDFADVIKVLSVDLTEDGEEVDVAADDGLEDLWGDHVPLEEDVQEEDIIDVLLLVGGVLEGLEGDDFLDWDNLLLNLDIDDLGFFNDNLAFSGDWLNNKLLVSDQSLNISLDLGQFPNDGLVGEQVPVDLVQEELVVSGSGGVWGVWGVLTSEAGGGWVRVTVVVGIWEDIPVPVVDIIAQFLATENVLRVDIVLMSVVVGGEGVLRVEELDKGLDVLVEEDGVVEVCLEGRDLPELLEVGGSHIPLEGWVLDVLAEDGESQVLTEELRVVELFEGEDAVHILVVVVVDPLESLQVGFVLDGVTLVVNGFLQWELVGQLLLQQQFIDDWQGVQQGLLLEQTEGVQIQTASGYGCDKGDEDKGFHDDSLLN